jgi:hypothetical protein
MGFELARGKEWWCWFWWVDDRLGVNVPFWIPFRRDMIFMNRL